MNTNPDLGAVFAALSDPTRRQLLEWMSAGERATATEFALRLPLTRQAVSRHLSELEGAGLVARSKSGRDVRYRLRPEPLAHGVAWMSERATAWDTALARLADHLAANPDAEPKPEE